MLEEGGDMLLECEKGLLEEETGELNLKSE